MSKRSKQSRAREFTPKARQQILLRDGGECIFCKMDYHMEKATWYSKQLLSIMHYIPRSRNGLGIPQNGAVGCQYHHEMLDNGNEGRRVEMIQLFREYLQRKYPDWNEEKLIYTKWK